MRETVRRRGVLATASFFLMAAALAWSMRRTEDSDPTSGARVDGAIERGLVYLRRNRSDLSALIVLDYLQRRYRLPPDLAFAAKDQPPPDSAKLGKWGRFVNFDQILDEGGLGPLTSTSTVDDVIMHALYCDRVRLPSTFVPILRGFTERGDYELTHTPLALKLARDNGCPLDEVDAVSFETSLPERLRRLIRRPAVDPRFQALDVRYEALAVLQDFLAERSASGSEVMNVLAEQQSEGGWRPAADQRSAAHPTVLAVWALLTWRHPDAPVVPFARGPWRR